MATLTQKLKKSLNLDIPTTEPETETAPATPPPLLDEARMRHRAAELRLQAAQGHLSSVTEQIGEASAVLRQTETAGPESMDPASITAAAARLRETRHRLEELHLSRAAAETAVQARQAEEQSARRELVGLEREAMVVVEEDRLGAALRRLKHVEGLASEARRQAQLQEIIRLDIQADIDAMRRRYLSLTGKELTTK